MGRISFISFIFLFFLNNAFGLVVGNPSDPGLYLDGIFTSYKKNYSLRASYLYDNIYKGRFEDKFVGLDSTPSDIKMKIFAGVLTFNIYNRLDIYGIVGSTNLQIDQLIYTDRRLAWAVGLKAILYKYKRFDFSLDGKYFSTLQKPQYFIVDKEVYPLAGSFEQHLEEYQASFGMSYNSHFLIPYIAATYLYSTISPTPPVGFITLPGGGLLLFETSDSVTRKEWGMALGITITNKKRQATLNIETRMFDQNAFAFVGTLRF